MNNQLQKGKLKRWNDGKGFGFIGSGVNGKDVFIHISALRKMGRRPVVGDVITYEIYVDNNGRKRAVNARIEGVKEAKSTTRRPRVERENNTNWISRIVSTALIVGGGVYAYAEFMRNGEPQGLITKSNISYSSANERNERYSCNGKVYCSEMTSCEEAEFYQHNCPGTKMDGDGDGIPCESQWCN